MICADVGTDSNSLYFRGRFWSIFQDADFLVRPVPSERKPCCRKTFLLRGQSPLFATNGCTVCCGKSENFNYLINCHKIFHHFSLSTVPFHEHKMSSKGTIKLKSRDCILCVEYGRRDITGSWCCLPSFEDLNSWHVNSVYLIYVNFKCWMRWRNQCVKPSKSTLKGDQRTLNVVKRLSLALASHFSVAELLVACWMFACDDFMGLFLSADWTTYIYIALSLYTSYFYLLLLHNSYASLVTTLHPVGSVSYSAYLWFKFGYCLKSEHFCPVKRQACGFSTCSLEFRLSNIFSHFLPAASFSFEKEFSMPVCFASWKAKWQKPFWDNLKIVRS